jgi:phosphoribosyl-AMP cyclohydrolase
MSKFPPAIAERFRAGELIAAIAQDSESKEVLMMAWMNEESLTKTLETKRATYWSRSRNALWVKGETSGHYQDLVSLSFDCDSDCLLLSVKQTGAA